MAKKIADTKKMTHEQWLELRKSSIGGSEIGAILGRNPYSSALTVYANKLGLSKDIEDNEAMRWGRDLESYVAERYMEKTGKKVRNDFAMYADDEYDYMTANIDRRIVGENAVLECKLMGNIASKYDFAAGEAPSQYYCQCQWYCMVLGLDRVDLAILPFYRDVEIVPIYRNDEFIADMRRKAVDFWENHVMKQIMPELDGSEACMDTLKELYPGGEADTEIRIYGLDSLIKDYKAYAELESDYKEKKERAKAIIVAKMGNNAVALGEESACSWKKQSKTSVDEKRLKAELPEIYEKYKKVSTFPVFRTRSLKKKEK